MESKKKKEKKSISQNLDEKKKEHDDQTFFSSKHKLFFQKENIYTTISTKPGEVVLPRHFAQLISNSVVV